MRKIKRFLFHSLKPIEHAKLLAVKAVKAHFNVGLQEAFHLVTEGVGSGKWIDNEWDIHEFTPDLHKYISIEIEYDYEEEPFVHPFDRELSPLEKEGLQWYERQDVLTKVMIDAYISSQNLCCIPSCA